MAEANSIAMMTPIRAETFEKLVFDAGILFKNWDYSSATDAASLAALVATEKAKTSGRTMMGATKGGINPQTSYNFWEPELDGKRMSFKGAKRMDSAEVKISGTLVEFTPDNVKAVLSLADKDTKNSTATKEVIVPRFDIKAGDYINNIIWVGNWGDKGLVLVDLQNCICTAGLNTQTTDKDIGTLPFEFTAHAGSVSSTELPIKYIFYSASAT